MDSGYILKVDEGGLVLFFTFLIGAGGVGEDGNQKFGFKYAEFEISFSYLGAQVKQAVGHMTLDLEEMSGLKTEMWESSVYSSTKFKKL